MSHQTKDGVSNRKKITWREREAILAELSASPLEVESVARKFNRGLTTVSKLGMHAGVGRTGRREAIRAAAGGETSPAVRIAPKSRVYPGTAR